MGQRASSESAVASEASSAIALVRRNLSRADDRPTLTYTEATVPQIQRIDQFHQKVPLLEPDRPYPLRDTLDVSLLTRAFRSSIRKTPALVASLS